MCRHWWRKLKTWTLAIEKPLSLYGRLFFLVVWQAVLDERSRQVGITIYFVIRQWQSLHRHHRLFITFPFAHDLLRISRLEASVGQKFAGGPRQWQAFLMPFGAFWLFQRGWQPPCDYVLHMFVCCSHLLLFDAGVFAKGVPCYCTFSGSWLTVFATCRTFVEVSQGGQEWSIFVHVHFPLYVCSQSFWANQKGSHSNSMEWREKSHDGNWNEMRLAPGPDLISSPLYRRLSSRGQGLFSGFSFGFGKADDIENIQ